MNTILIGLIFTIIAFIFFIFTLKKNKKIHFILFIAFFSRIAMAWIFSFVLDNDPDGYQSAAEHYMKLPFFEYISSFQTGAYIYSWFIAAIWKITGVNTIIIRIINGILSYECCLMVYSLSKQIFKNEKYANKVLIWSALFPTLIRFSSPFASRETIFIFVLLSSVYALYKYYMSNKFKYIISFFVFIVFAIILHISAVCMFILLGIIILKKSKTKRGIISAILLAIVVALGVIFMLKNNIGTEKLYLNKGGLNSEKIAWIQESSSSGRAAYLKGFNSNNIFIIILQLPIRIIYFLYTPFIWMITSIIDILGIMDAILYIWISKKNLDFYKKYKKNTEKEIEFAKYLLLTSIAMIAVLAIGTSNYGTALRHRSKVILLLLITAAPMLDKKVIKE